MNDGRNDSSVSQAQQMMEAAYARLTLAIAGAADSPDQAFPSQFEELVDQLEFSFRAEESIMEASNYQALRSHREQHARVLASLHQLEPQIEDGHLAPGRHALELLPEWLSAHHTTIDRAVVTTLQQNRAHP